jgi:hypothetical protein
LPRLLHTLNLSLLSQLIRLSQNSGAAYIGKKARSLDRPLVMFELGMSAVSTAARLPHSSRRSLTCILYLPRPKSLVSSVLSSSASMYTSWIVWMGIVVLVSEVVSGVFMTQHFMAADGAKSHRLCDVVGHNCLILPRCSVLIQRCRCKP